MALGGSIARMWKVTLNAGVLAWAVSTMSAPLAAEYAVEAPLASRSLLLDGARVGDHIVAVGERGHILLSEDAGHTWRQVPVPTRALLTAVYFHDERRGWAVGHDAVILRSEDGGQSWVQVYADPDEERPLLDVWFRDENHGFAVGAYGYFLETRDGGDSWTSRRICEDDWHFNDLAQVGGGRLIIAAEAGNLYASDDGGATWVGLESPYVGSLFRILPIGGNDLLVLGLRGHVFRSGDAGSSWEEVATGTLSSLLAGARLTDGRIVAAGLAGSVVWSSDGGHHFTSRPEPDRHDIAALVETADGRILALGVGGSKELPIP